MDAKTLYIVGNGFDRQHGIPSDYQDFKAFVELHDDDVFGWVEEFVPAGEDWAHLETALAELDTGSIIESLEHFMPSYSSDEWSDSGHHDFQYEVERVASGLSSRLQALFGQWVREPSRWLLRADGDSLQGIGIYDGDVLVVDKALEPLDGDIVVVVIGADFCCKEYRERLGKSPILLAHNPLNASIEVGEWEDIELWGIVLHNLHRVSR